MMDIDIIKTTQSDGAVYIKYKTSVASPEYHVTIVFKIEHDGELSFKMTEESLRDLVRLLKSKG